MGEGLGVTYLLQAVPQVQLQPGPRGGLYRTEPGWCDYSPTPLHTDNKVTYTLQLLSSKSKVTALY